MDPQFGKIVRDIERTRERIADLEHIAATYATLEARDRERGVADPIGLSGMIQSFLETERHQLQTLERVESAWYEHQEEQATAAESTPTVVDLLDKRTRRVCGNNQLQYLVQWSNGKQTWCAARKLRSPAMQHLKKKLCSTPSM